MLFFERRKTERGEWPKIFSKNSFPQNVRTQCWQICENHINPLDILEQIRHAVGMYRLNSEGNSRGYFDEGNIIRELNYFFHHGLNGGNSKEDVEYALSVLELMCHRLPERSKLIDAINYRLRLGGVGYKYSDGKLIPVDDEQLTETAVIPAMSLLNRPEFEKGYGYLHQAFLDYRQGTQESLQTAVDNCVKSIEAILKTIFDHLHIEYGPKDTYMPLIQKAANSGLFPDISDDKLSPLTNQLKAIGEIRNKESGHGGDKQISDKLVRLAIHHTTANLLYIAECYLERK